MGIPCSCYLSHFQFYSRSSILYWGLERYPSGGGVIGSILIIIGLLKALKAIDLITAIDISLKSLKI
jgi:hypothetical protein